MLLVCNTTFQSDDVVTPGHSNHCIIMARLINENKKYCKIYIYRKAVAKISCESNMWETLDLEIMRDIFSITFREAIELSVPKHTVKIRSEDQLPPWFNPKAEKLHNTQSLFCSEAQRARRDNKNAFRQIKRKYIKDKIRKPLWKGNSKPFYRTFDRSKNTSTH